MKKYLRISIFMGLIGLSGFLGATALASAEEVSFVSPSSQIGGSPSHIWEPQTMCRGVHVWGYHKGNGGNIAVSYIDPRGQFQVYQYALSPTGLLGNVFDMGIETQSGGRILLVKMYYPTGIHIANAKFFSC